MGYDENLLSSFSQGPCESELYLVTQPIWHLKQEGHEELGSGRPCVQHLDQPNPWPGHQVEELYRRKGFPFTTATACFGIYLSDFSTLSVVNAPKVG